MPPRSALVAVALIACAARAHTTPVAVPRDLTTLSWLPGLWCGTHGDGAFCEVWQPDGAAFDGAGGEVQPGAEGFSERLRIEVRPDGVYYVATPRGEGTTAFRLTRADANDAVFENPQHDFPTRITYHRVDARHLAVVVESSSRRIVFDLARVEGLLERPLDRAFRCAPATHGPAEATASLMLDTGGDSFAPAQVGIVLVVDGPTTRCSARVASCVRATTGEETFCDGERLCVRGTRDAVTVERAGREVFRDRSPVLSTAFAGVVACEARDGG